MHLPAVLPMRPRYVEKLWGGARLAALPAKRRRGHAPPPHTRIGESWEVADLPEGCSVVDGGPLAGRTLREVVQLFGADVTGGPDRFPLLVKLIDAGDDLSVQVHPDHAWARSHPQHFAKDEAWVVVDADAGARVRHGFRDGTDAASFRRAIEEGRAEQLLRELRVSRGDVLRIRPGTMHAVGRGCLLLEVQEPSDTTFRVWDYNRREADGRARPLHVEEALAVARFGPQDPPLIGDARPGARFDAEGYSLGFHLAPHEVGAGPAVVFVIEGEARIDDFTVPVGGACVVPAAARNVAIEGDALVMVASTP